MIGGTKSVKVFQEWKAGVRAMALPFTEADMNKAEEHFKKAIALEATRQTGKPTTFQQARKANNLGYPRAWSRYGYVKMTRFMEGWDLNALADADEFTKRAVRLDDTDYDVHWDRAFFFQLTSDGKPKKNFDRALKEYDRAQQLNDGNDELRVEASEVYVSIGDHDKALAELRRAGRVINHEWFWWDMAWVYYFKARLDPVYYDVALEQFRAMHWQPGDARYVFDAQLLKAAIHAQKAAIHKKNKNSKGQKSEEQLRDVAMAHFRAKKDDLSMRSARRNRAKWNLGDEKRARPFALKVNADRDHWLNGCKLAGL